MGERKKVLGRFKFGTKTHSLSKGVSLVNYQIRPLHGESSGKVVARELTSDAVLP